MGDFSITGLAGQRKWSSGEETVLSKTSTFPFPFSKNTEDEAFTSTFLNKMAKVRMGCRPQEAEIDGNVLGKSW